MYRKHPIRLATAALAAVALTMLAVPGRADAYEDIDTVKLTSRQIDFGSDDWVGLLSEPWGSARIYWDVVDGFSTPKIVGWLHLNNAAYQYARIYLTFYDGAGNYVSQMYSDTEYVWNNDHHSFGMDLRPYPDRQIVSLRVCTELSDDGQDFEVINCKIRDMN